MACRSLVLCSFLFHRQPLCAFLFGCTQHVLASLPSIPFKASFPKSYSLPQFPFQVGPFRRSFPLSFISVPHISPLLPISLPSHRLLSSTSSPLISLTHFNLSLSQANRLQRKGALRFPPPIPIANTARPLPESIIKNTLPPLAVFPVLPPPVWIRLHCHNAPSRLSPLHPHSQPEGFVPLSFQYCRCIHRAQNA